MAADVRERLWTARPATSDDREDQRRLFNTCFRKQKSVDTFLWKYERNPDGPAISRVACAPDGQVVGSYSYVPRRFRRDGESVVLCQASDAMTDPAWQGKGIFTGLDDVVCAAAGEAGSAWAYAYSGRLSLKGFLRNGWQCLGHAPVFRYRFRSERSLRRLGRIGPLAARLAPLVDLSLGGRARARFGASDGSGTEELVRLDRFDQRVDALFDAVCPPTGLVGERHADWLNWRYVDNPTGRQECFALLRGEELAGYLVAEFVDGNAYLVDHLAAGPDDLATLLRAFTTLAWTREMEEATAMHFDHHPAVPLLLQLGYERPRGRKPFRDVFPWIVRACREDAPGADLALDRWHVSDGDRDAEHMSA